MQTLKVLVVALGLLAGAAMGFYGGFSVVEPAVGIATLCAAGAGWWEARRERRRGLEEVRVTLHLGGEEGEIVLPLFLLRRDVSRAELLGRIGMLPMRQPGQRFTLSRIGSPEVIRGINSVARGEADTLRIPATREEVEQFDLPRF